MFGFKTVRATTLSALETKITDLETQVKGYYENVGAFNDYFRAIDTLLQGFSVRDNYLEVSRVNIQRCYEQCMQKHSFLQ